MTGLVLCGGTSTRMGSDKGLLKENGQTWAETAAQKFKSLSLPVILSVNRDQLAAYSIYFDEKQLLPDSNAIAVKGPLLGLLSAHLKLPEENFLVLACDVKDMNVALLQNLINQSTEDEREAFVYTSKERPQPLCGVYTSGGLKKIYQRQEAGELKRFSMMHVLNLLNTKYISISEEDAAAFNNYNSPDQL